MTIWLTGQGVVGQRLIQQCSSQKISLTNPRRDPLPDVYPGDIVVLAYPGRHRAVVEHAGQQGASVIVLADDLNDTQQLFELDALFTSRQSSLVVGAAMSPGLSGLIARHLAGRLHRVDELHIAMHGTAGPACARVHHRSLSGHAPGLMDGEWKEFHGGSGRELCWFPEPIGAVDCYRAESPLPVLLHRAFPEARRISSRRSATRRDRLTARLPMLRPPHAEGGVGALRVEVRGATADGARETLVMGIAELVGSASAAVVAAMITELTNRGLPTGVVIPGAQELPTHRLLHHVQEHGVRIQEFTGQPSD